MSPDYKFAECPSIYHFSSSSQTNYHISHDSRKHQISPKSFNVSSVERIRPGWSCDCCQHGPESSTSEYIPALEIPSDSHQQHQHVLTSSQMMRNGKQCGKRCDQHHREQRRRNTCCLCSRIHLGPYTWATFESTLSPMFLRDTIA